MMKRGGGGGNYDLLPSTSSGGAGKHDVLLIQFPMSVKVALWFLVGLSIANVVMMGILLGGGWQSMSQLSRMESGLNDMNGLMQDSGEQAKSLAKEFMSKFPSDQPEVVARDVMALVANARRITDEIHASDIQAVKGQVLGGVEQVTRVVSQIQMDHINGLIARSQELAQALDPAKINAFIDSTKSLEERLQNLHEIKIQV